MTDGDGWASLVDRFTGELLRPGSPSYEKVHRPALARFSAVRPAAVARCRTPAEVAQALAHATGRQLPFAVRSGGHDFAGRSTTPGLLVDVGAMDTVAVTGDRVVVGPGARLGTLYQVLHRDGLTVPGGSGRTVGVAGLTLGSGFGLLGRRHGLLCDRLLAAQVVLADGRILTCDQHRHGDVFWLLRGAGATGAGVVTKLTFATVPAPRCTVFELTWDYRHAAAAVAAWQDWAPDAPDPVAASLLLTAPADLTQPPQLAVLGTAADHSTRCTARLLDTLTAAVGAPSRTSWAQSMTWLDARRWLGDRAPDDGHGVTLSKSGFFRQPLPPPTINELVDALSADRVPGQARELDFSPWGGAYNRVPIGATAFPHRAERFLLKHATISHVAAQTNGWLSRSWSTAQPWGSGGVYPNFPDSDLPDPDRAYYGANLDRIRRIHAAYDPDSVFQRSSAQS